MFVSFLDKEDGNKPTINSVKKVCDKSNLFKGLRAYSKLSRFAVNLIDLKLMYSGNKR